LITLQTTRSLRYLFVSWPIDLMLCVIIFLYLPFTNFDKNITFRLVITRNPPIRKLFVLSMFWSLKCFVSQVLNQSTLTLISKHVYIFSLGCLLILDSLQRNIFNLIEFYCRTPKRPNQVAVSSKCRVLIGRFRSKSIRNVWHYQRDNQKPSQKDREYKNRTRKFYDCKACIIWYLTLNLINISFKICVWYSYHYLMIRLNM